MKYKRFLDLTDDEIKDIVTDIFKPLNIGCIERNKDWNEIEVEIVTTWEVDEDEDPIEITDTITLRYTSDWCDGFPVKNNDYWKWIRFLCDKGVSPYYEALKDKEENDLDTE